MNVFEDKTVAEYLLLDDKSRSKIDAVLEFVKPKKTLSRKYNGKVYKYDAKVSDMFSLSFKQVIYVKKLLASKGSLNTINEVLKQAFPIRTKEQFYNCSIFDVFACYYWMLNGMKSIYDAEKNKLFKKPSQKQLRAGIETFEQLEDIPSIDGIANGNMLEWDAVLELPYGVVMRKMLLNKLTNEYSENYSKLKD